MYTANSCSKYWKHFSAVSLCHDSWWYSWFQMQQIKVILCFILMIMFCYMYGGVYRSGNIKDVGIVAIHGRHNRNGKGRPWPWLPHFWEEKTLFFFFFARQNICSVINCENLLSPVLLSDELLFRGWLGGRNFFGQCDFYWPASPQWQGSDMKAALFVIPCDAPVATHT